jgi:hypothetical protein
MGAAVIAHPDLPPAFQFGKHVLNLMATFVERLAVVDRLFAVLGRRYAHPYPSLVQRNVVASVADRQILTALARARR